MFPNLDWFSRRLLSPDGRADRDVHAAVRDRAHQRLGGARHRAEGRRQDHPPERQLHRPGGAAIRAAGASAPDSREPAHVRQTPQSAERPAPDAVLTAIADYVLGSTSSSDLAYETAHYCLMDTLAAAFRRCEYPACTKLLGPVVPGTVVPNGARVPGTQLRARSGAGGLQHRRHDPLAGFQRHLARGGVGPSVRQSGRHPRGRRLARRAAARRQKPLDRARRAHRDDQGA